MDKSIVSPFLTHGVYTKLRTTPSYPPSNARLFI